MRRAEPVVPRDARDLGAAQRMPPPPSSSSALSARRLYIDDRATSSKVASLSSVSPTSSTRELTMRSLSSDEDEASHAVRTVDNNKDFYHTQHTKTVVHRRETQRGTSTRSTKASAALADVRLEADPAGDELQHIKDSVQRLRAQRTHVEQLRHRNERLERLLADGAAETERLRLQVASLRGVEQENVGLLRSFQMLEERIRALETTCSERREDARVALERLTAAEKARDTLQLRVDELAGEREHCRQLLASAQAAHEKRLEELTTAHERALEKVQHAQSEWQAKLQDAQLTQGHVERRFQDELGELQRENQQLVRENRAMEQHVQQLLATTVRQTTMIEDCDRLLHESKARHAAAKASYREQLQLAAGLREQVQQLESQLSASEVGGATDKRALEAKLQELETKTRKLKDKNEIYAVALREKENHCEKLQNELLVRDRARLHAEDVVKELRQQDKTLRSEISTLQVKLADLTDEKSILQDQLRALQEQLEKERRDRSRWATARLKLLAEFCDEENKLSSALHQHSALDMFVDEGSEAVLEDDLVDPGDGEEEDGGGDVAAAVMAAGLKMDALDRKFHGHQGIQEAVKHQRPPGKSIVFG